MSAWTRVASFLGIHQRVAGLDPVFAAVNQRYLPYGALPMTPEQAERKVAIGSAVRLLTNAARIMPVHAFRGQGADTSRIPDPLILRDPDATGRGSGDWVAQAVWSLATRGNLMVHVLERDSNARPATVEVCHPDRVRPEVDRRTGVITWNPAEGKAIPGYDMLHVRLHPVPGEVLGLSPIEQHAATIGLGIAAEKFGSDFFTAGGHPTALLKSASPLNDEQGRRVKSRFMSSAASREPVLLPDGISYEQIQVKPGESQFLDAQGYSAAECARIFGPGVAEILGYETGGSMTYANIVDRDLILLKYTLDPYLVVVEQLLSRCLPQPQYVRLNRASLLRTNTTERYRAYQIAAEIGLQTPNEQRALEDMPAVAWGDEPFAPTKKTITERIGLDASTPTQAANDLEGAA